MEFHKCSDFGYKLNIKYNTKLFSFFLSLLLSLCPLSSLSSLLLSLSLLLNSSALPSAHCIGTLLIFATFNFLFLCFSVHSKTTGGAVAAGARTLRRGRTGRSQSSSQVFSTAPPRCVRWDRTLSSCSLPLARAIQKGPLHRAPVTRPACSWRRRVCTLLEPPRPVSWTRVREQVIRLACPPPTANRTPKL